MRVIHVEISDQDEMALRHDLVSIDDWVRDAVAGKVASCTKRLAAAAVETLRSDPSVASLPGTAEEQIAALVAREDYRDRATKERAADLNREIERRSGAVVKFYSDNDPDRDTLRGASKLASEARDRVELLKRSISVLDPKRETSLQAQIAAAQADAAALAEAVDKIAAQGQARRDANSAAITKAQELAAVAVAYLETATSAQIAAFDVGALGWPEVPRTPA